MTDDTHSLAAPDIVDVEPASAAVVWARVSFAEIPAHQRNAIAHIDAALERAGMAADGVRLTFSRNPDGGMLDVAPGRMVAEADATPDDVTVETISAGRAAHLSFRGPYIGLAQAWRRLGGWIIEQGVQSSGPCWEVYTDPEGPVTDLYIMLA